MLYAIIGHDVTDSLERRLAARAAHRARLEQLQQEGKLILAGPFPAIDSMEPGPAGYQGSLIVAEFQDLAQAQAWAQADPYLVAGVYSSIEVKPFRQVFPL